MQSCYTEFMGAHFLNHRPTNMLRRLGVTLALCAGYLILAWLLYPVLRNSIGGLSSIPVVLIAWLYGMGWGGASGFFLGLGVFLLLSSLNPTQLTPASPLVNIGLGTLVGLGVGRISDQSKALRATEKDLELRVHEQTIRLSELVEELRREVAERKQAEEIVNRMNVELERRVAERTAQLEAANAELQSFTYSVSHDLRAPLRAIAGFSQILSGEFSVGLDPQALNYLKRIRESAVKMSALINNLLVHLGINTQLVKRRGPCLDKSI